MGRIADQQQPRLVPARAATRLDRQQRHLVPIRQRLHMVGEARLQLGADFQFLPEYFRAHGYIAKGVGKVPHTPELAASIQWDCSVVLVRQSIGPDRP